MQREDDVGANAGLPREDDVVVEFQPVGRRVTVPPGASLLAAAQQASRDLGEWGIRSTCGGRGTCGQCRVKVCEGAVSGVDEAEREMLLRLRADPSERLACQVRVLGPVKVELERLGGAQLQVKGTGAQAIPDPSLEWVEFRLSPPLVGDRRGDWERLLAALPRTSTGEGNWVADFSVLQELSPRLREWSWQGAVVTRGNEVISVHPRRQALLGLAVDLGTTKIAGYLADLETGEIVQSGAIMNPQIPFGEDVVSRLGYAASSEENCYRIRRAVVEGLNRLAADLCRAAGGQTDMIQEAVICGNTAMHHLLAGLGVSQLALAPYVPALASPLDVKARELGLELAAGAYVHLVPGVAGYVGGDHVAMLLATRLHQYPGVALGIDVGTNTEIALVRDGVVTCCSCASGPAFEGGHVTRGMRALTGAIDRVWWEGDEVKYRVIGGGEPIGFCGAGLIDLLAVLRHTGAVDARGRLVSGAAGVVETPQGREFVLGGVPLSQGDVRQLQLAKAAIRSGIEGLLKTTGTVAEQVERVLVAGAFGVALDPACAVAIGMFPPFQRETFVPVGNAAGMGAHLCLISRRERQEAARLARSIRYLELMTLPDYQDLFLAGIGFPHPTPCFSGVVQ